MASAASPSWVILGTVPRVTAAADDIPPGADLSLALKAPPRVALLTIHPRIFPGRTTPDNFPSVLAVDASGLLLLEADQCLATGPTVTGYFVLDAKSASALPLPNAKYFMRLPPGHLGIVAFPAGLIAFPADNGNYMVAELKMIVGGDTCDLLRFSSDVGEWVKNSIPYPLPSRILDPTGVVSHSGRLWWVDLSCCLLTCDPFEDAPELRVVPLPPGKVLKCREGWGLLDKYRCVGVSGGKLRFVDMYPSRSRLGAFLISVWTLANPDSTEWTLEYEATFAEICADESYKATGLPRKIPVLALIHPTNPDVVYFFLDDHMLGVDVRARKVVECEVYELVGPPTEVATRFVRAWQLPRALCSGLMDRNSELKLSSRQFGHRMLRGEREINEGGTLMSQPRRQLYIILDDWELGFSVRKVDLDLDQLISGGRKARDGATCLPSPIIRFRAHREPPIYFSDAFGSKILAMQPKDEGKPDLGNFCYDVHERSLKCIPRHTHQHRPFYFPIGDKLFALGHFSMEVLDLHPLVSPSCQLGGLSWLKLPDAPLDSMDVVSRAVLPDGKTIFVSVDFSPTTYSFHMAEDGSFKWENLGQWILPFDGCGCFYPELGTWVGVALYEEEPGRICSCKLASTTSDCRPEVKYSKEYLFSEDPAEKHLGCSLVYMGGHERKFCLVECIMVGNRDDQGYYNFGEENTDNRDEGACKFGEGNMDPQPRVRMFRLTKFSLKLDEKGDLTTGDTQRVRYYKVPKKEMSDLTFALPLAFWL